MVIVRDMPCSPSRSERRGAEGISTVYCGVRYSSCLGIVACSHLSFRKEAAERSTNSIPVEPDVYMPDTSTLAAMD